MNGSFEFFLEDFVFQSKTLNITAEKATIRVRVTAADSIINESRRVHADYNLLLTNAKGSWGVDDGITRFTLGSLWIRGFIDMDVNSTRVSGSGYTPLIAVLARGL